MSRPRTPTEILDVRGSFIANPARAHEREHEPTSDRPLGEPPARLSEECKAVWHEVAAQMLPGVCKVSDRQMFEVLVRLIAKIRAGAIRMTELSTLISLCGRFAMSPADRSKVTVSAESSTSLTRFLASRSSSQKVPN